MKYLIIFILLYSSFFMDKLFGQVDSTNQSGYIYVKKKRAEVPSISYKPQRDLYNSTVLIRINLLHRANIPLSQAILHAPWAKGRRGIVMAVVEGLKNKLFVGLHPQNPKKAYIYTDLIYDLLELEEMDPGQFTEEEIFQIIEHSVENVIDLVAEQGFSIQSSRRFFRIRFLRLIWHNPNMAKAPHLLTLIPYQSITKILAGIMVKPHHLYHEATIRMRDFLDHQRFLGYAVKNNRMLVLHPAGREAAMREEELWER